MLLSNRPAPQRSGVLVRFSLLLALGPAVGCSPPCAGMFFGERGAAPELRPARLEAGQRLVPLADGDEVDLVRPIQGGHVLFVGALVRNVDACSGSLRGELRRDQGGRPGGILVSDERSTELGPEASGALGPGWGGPMPDPGEIPNVPACPNVLADELLDVPVWLQLTYAAGAVSVSGAVRVLPRCRQPDEAKQRLCRCECQAGYTIDRCLIR